MQLAKNYQQYETIGEPYQAHQHWYQKININGQITEARLYNDEEYNRMYPPNLVSVKEQLGFNDNTIYLIEGNTAALKDWLNEINARYHKLFGWYAVEPVNPIPEGITIYPLEWKQVSINNKYLRPDQEIDEIVSSIKFGSSPSQFMGEVGKKISAVLYIKKVVKLNTRYGETNMHIMQDANENVFIWMTNSRDLVEGQIYGVSGTVKAHETYRGEKRTILVRCQIKEMNKEN